MRLGITGSKFGDWFLVAVVAGFCLSLVIGTLVAFQTGADTAVSQFLWAIDDPTWMPPGQSSIPIFGLHHFGDWQIFYGWALDKNPYLLSPLAFNGLPIFYWMLVLTAGVGLKLSFIAMWGGTLIVAVSCFYVGLRFLPTANRLLIILTLMFFTVGIIWTFTRGSLQGLAIGLLMIAAYFYNRNQHLYSGLLFAIACSIKPYLLLVLLWPLLDKRHKETALFVAAFGLSSLIAFYFMEGSITETISGWIAGNTHYSTNSGAYLMTKGVGLFSLALYLLGIIQGSDGVTNFLDSYPSWTFMIPGALWLAGIVFIILKNKISKSLQFIFILAASQLVMPASQIYTMVFASFASILFFRYLYQSRPEDHRKILPVLISIATALVGTLVPLQFTLEIHGFTIWNFGAILSPLLWAISLVTIVFYSAFAKNTTPIPKMPLALQLHTQVSTENL